MKGFFKKVNCPSSQELADLENGSLSGRRLIEVQDHLDGCDFCDAEAELYARFPIWPDDHATDIIAEMPQPLFELAESIFRGRDSSRDLDQLMTEHQGVH